MYIHIYDDTHVYKQLYALVYNYTWLLDTCIPIERDIKHKSINPKP